MSKFQRKKTESLSKGPKRQMPYHASLLHACFLVCSPGASLDHSVALPSWKTLVLLPIGDSMVLAARRIFTACPAWVCHITEKKRVSEG